jgi:hypothetical protein
MVLTWEMGFDCVERKGEFGLDTRQNRTMSIVGASQCGRERKTDHGSDEYWEGGEGACMNEQAKSTG